MKTALLIYFTDTKNNKSGYIWETPTEKILSSEFSTKQEALQNKPDQSIYVCRHDDYSLVK